MTDDDRYADGEGLAARALPRRLVRVATTGRTGSVVRWLARWGISIGSFVSGVFVLFVFRRELPHVQWIVGYVVLLWLLVAIVTQVRQALEARGRRFVVTAADYTIQTLYHGLLLFLLPAYWASTTLASPNAVFVALLVALTVLATFDPWYRALVHPRPWLGLVCFVVSIFGALNVALPLVGIRPDIGLLLAAWVSAVALAPVVRRALGWRWSRTLHAMAAAGIVFATAAWTLRAAIPPAPLSLGRAVIARAVDHLAPVGPIDEAISERELREAGALVAYTAVYAPAGLRQPVAHVWRRNGDVVARVSLAPVRGGRREGFRTFSRMSSFPYDGVTGRWTVDVVTSSGQLIGRLRFRVTP
ncbi:MAG: DUF2914 domain-containing protein [Candidatus Rokubacteria bacterium]|nr:DUF2914 domain-containing protein [Candidatus Rokubacteria bacterium]